MGEKEELRACKCGSGIFGNPNGKRVELRAVFGVEPEASKTVYKDLPERSSLGIPHQMEAEKNKRQKSGQGKRIIN